MITEIMVTCSIAACQPIVSDAMNRAKDIKEHVLLVDSKPLKLYTSDGYGYLIKVENNRETSK